MASTSLSVVSEPKVYLMNKSELLSLPILETAYSAINNKGTSIDVISRHSGMSPGFDTP